jgi:hypothetical protein
VSEWREADMQRVAHEAFKQLTEGGKVAARDHVMGVLKAMRAECEAAEVAGFARQVEGLVVRLVNASRRTWGELGLELTAEGLREKPRESETDD